MRNIGEPIHMTLHEVRQYLQTLYSSSSDSSENKIKRERACSGQNSLHFATPKMLNINNNNRYSTPHTDSSTDTPISNKSSNGLIHNNNNGNIKKHKKNSLTGMKHKKKDDKEKDQDKMKKGQRNFSLNLKQTLCNIFRFRRLGSPEHYVDKRNSIVQGEIAEEEENLEYEQHANNNNTTTDMESSMQKMPFFKRALPPLPKNNGHIETAQVKESPVQTVSKCESPASIRHTSVSFSRDDEDGIEDTSMDFAASIEKVKDVISVFWICTLMFFFYIFFYFFFFDFWDFISL